MGAVFMSAGILTAIILCVIGLAKLPCGKFKEKYPKVFKATFTGLSIVLTFGACLINQAFVLNQPLFNIDFWVMLVTTIAGVFGLYHSYEGLGAKELVKILVSNVKAWFKSATPDSKIAKGVAKLEKQAEKLGFNVSVNVVKAEKSEINQVEVEKVENAVVENTIVENQVINAEHVEVNNANVQNTTINQ